MQSIDLHAKSVRLGNEPNATVTNRVCIGPTLRERASTISAVHRASAHRPEGPADSSVIPPVGLVQLSGRGAAVNQRVVSPGGLVVSTLTMGSSRLAMALSESQSAPPFHSSGQPPYAGRGHAPHGRRRWPRRYRARPRLAALIHRRRAPDSISSPRRPVPVALRRGPDLSTAGAAAERTGRRHGDTSSVSWRGPGEGARRRRRMPSSTRRARSCGSCS